MAAPTPTPRVAPSGFKLPDGFSSTVTLANLTNIQLWEKEVKPADYDGGELIDTSTMFNSRFHTFAMRKLIKSGNVVNEVAYDPDVIINIQNILNSPTVVTVTWPTLDTWCAYGGIIKFEPKVLKEGEFPMATATFGITNYDFNNNVEAGPVYTASAGT